MYFQSTNRASSSFQRSITSWQKTVRFERCTYEFVPGSCFVLLQVVFARRLINPIKKPPCFPSSRSHFDFTALLLSVMRQKHSALNCTQKQSQNTCQIRAQLHPRLAGRDPEPARGRVLLIQRHVCVKRT